MLQFISLCEFCLSWQLPTVLIDCDVENEAHHIVFYIHVHDLFSFSSSAVEVTSVDGSLSIS